MGNSQSHHVGPHNKLSKPKTNSNSPSLSSRFDSPVSVSSKYADLSVRTRDSQMLKAHLTASIETEAQPDRTPSREDRLGELAARLQSHLSSPSATSVASPRGNGRLSSLKLSSLPGSKLSLVSGSQRVDLDATMKVAYDVKRDSREDPIALGKWIFYLQ